MAPREGGAPSGKVSNTRLPWDSFLQGIGETLECSRQGNEIGCQLCVSQIDAQNPEAEELLHQPGQELIRSDTRAVAAGRRGHSEGRRDGTAARQRG